LNFCLRTAYFIDRTCIYLFLSPWSCETSPGRFLQDPGMKILSPEKEIKQALKHKSPGKKFPGLLFVC
jgi:hypothetical protein